MIDRMQESANKRERKAQQMEKERERQERRDRGEDTTENEEVSGPLKLDDLVGSHLQPCQKSEADGEYE